MFKKLNILCVLMAMCLPALTMNEEEQAGRAPDHSLIEQVMIGLGNANNARDIDWHLRALDILASDQQGFAQKVRNIYFDSSDNDPANQNDVEKQ